MIELRLEEVAAAVGGRVRGDARQSIAEVSTDTRTLEPGALFVALPGEHGDGHDYAGDAVAAGAAAVLASKPVEVPVPVVTVADTWEALTRLAGEVRTRVDPTVVAVTGSVGKTTTKDLIAAATRSSRRTLAAPGSYNNELGVPLTLLGLEPDTELLVAELGARGVGHIAGLVPVVRPDVGVVTRVAGVHLELFGDLDAIARAKTELVAGVADAGHVVLNADDERVAAMAEHTGAQVVRYSLSRSGPADVWARELSLDRLATPTLTVGSPWGTTSLRVPVPGVHNAGNALAALAVAGVLGVDLRLAARGIAEAHVSQWRGEIHETAGVVVLNDAYNANPTAVAAALRTLQAIECPGRRWAVLGIMAEIGPTHEAEHARVGRLAARLGIDRLVVVGDGAAAIAAGAREEGLDGRAVAVVDDVAGALERVSGELADGDAVLVKASRVAGLEAVAEGLRVRLDGEGPA